MSKKNQADKFASMVEGAQSVQRPSNLTIDEPARPATKSQREKGRSHPDNKDKFTSTTVYLEKTLHKRVKAALLDDDEDLSVRVEKLLAEWLENRKD